ncbi:hypothetical protein SNEBB_006608 [Seison nebaliae]|nr:hypothetical protein SNEBB_006608 [Seison nebaliae]
MSSQYNFKKIAIVPPADQFIDIVLSKTQRKTPTVIHKQYAIARIRQFYTRKIKFCQQTFHDKLEEILKDFPKIEDVHPFYRDLMNILYDKDHYKLALGQLNMCKSIIDNVAKEYVRLMKYADSLYRSKCLKRAALGRMCTIMKKQASALQYLEQVRQHLSRLPSIDPNTRTIILCGFPNVGKSSFINKISRADVEVQPYAFTTKSLYVGHTDYEFFRWQVIDTPGILDHSVDERNTIEMQSITALAHLRASIVYVVDVSEQCGYSLEEQMDLFRNIQPLFLDKPLTMALNKIDAVPLDELSEEHKELLKEVESSNENRIPKFQMVPMSTLRETGVMEVRAAACDELLKQRVEIKMKSKSNDQSFLNRLTIAHPVKRDDKVREEFIPESVRLRREKEFVKFPKNLTNHDVELKDQEDYQLDLRREWDLNDNEEKYDILPSFYNGYNIADYVHPDIINKIHQLEMEEEERETNGTYDDLTPDEIDEEMRTIQKLASIIKEKKSIMKQDSQLNKKNRNNRSMAKTLSSAHKLTVDQLLNTMEDLGVDMTKKQNLHVVDVALNKEEKKLNKMDNEQEKALQVVEEIGYDVEMDGIDTSSLKAAARSLMKKKLNSLEDIKKLELLKNKLQERSRNRLISQSETRVERLSKLPRNVSGLKNIDALTKVKRINSRSNRRFFKEPRKGEADRHIGTKMPKHLFSGKRSMGKTDRR